MAKSQPQIAYAALIHRFRHKLTYFMRTIPNFSDKLKILDETIDKKLVPALIDRKISPSERKLLSLPVKCGGMGIPILSELCEEELINSQKLTEKSKENVKSQKKEYNLDLNYIK